ncbi:hypothetical protein Esi_0083_0033 [Ectocarpus siliculosus]|uniref:WW domain-containing protein n=1 Tax=Ectocarpus siliculosus TaxID=2880 RepID=D7G7G6_ECTSI|nr:hypothetical protein Esi_0083_0033 [Ectocarpus siliculosus]|eukprot:CBJ27708.1 hypothetical protein Esi_0083_0033 [Ectocarpus siliculosus]
MAPEALNFGGGMRNARDWDDRGALALAPTASSRRAVAAKLAASAARSAEMLPTYRYGLDLTGNGSAKNGPSRGPPQRQQLAILEHRRELEKSLVVCRLREQVERLRAKLDENPNGSGTSPARAACPAPFMSRVVDIPSAVTALKPKTSHKRGTTRPEKEEEPIRNGSPSVAVYPADKEECSLSSDGAMSTRHNPRQEDAGRDHSRQRPHNPRNPDDLPQQQHQLQQHQQQGYPQSPQTATSPQESAVRDREDARGGRQRQRKGEVLVSSRAKAGLLGVLAPGGSRGYMKIDGPIATGSSLGRDRAKRVGVDARGASGAEKGGRVGLTTEMEVDVMKGLVLAQHQRIERQRTRMQELERDLRDYRRATVLGGEWPPPPWLRQLNLPAWKGGLTPSRSAPAGLDRFTGARFAATGNNSGNGSKIDNDGRRTFASSGSASRSAECSPQRQQRQKERRGSGGGEGGGGSGIANTCPVERSGDWAEDSRGTRAVFSPKRRPTSSSCCSSVTSMANDRNGNRPRPATAGGNTRAERRRIRGNRCGHNTIATGSDGTAGKYRPRSASSRLYSPLDQSGDNQTSQWARNGSTSVGGDVNGGHGGGGAGFVWEAEKAGLPEGWAEAVDEESGHVYYFSGKRSTWVKPVAPASPRYRSHSLGACQATNAINGDGNEDAHSVILSTAATGLAGSLPQAAEATTPGVAISTRERDKAPDGILEDGRLAERVDTKAASTAVLARPVDSPDEEQEDSTETNIRPETGRNVPPAASGPERAVGEGAEEGKSEERHGSLHRLSSTNIRGFSNGSSGVPESPSGFDDAMLPIRGRSGNSAPSDHRGRGPSWPSNNGLDGSILAGTRKSRSVVHDTVDAFTSTSLPQKIVEGKVLSRANGIQPEEAEPSRPREASGVDRLSSDVQEEAGSATSRVRSNLLPQARENDEGDDDVEGYKTTPTCYRANFGSDQSSPLQVIQTEALPATESSPDAADDVATDALVSNTASAKKNETPPLETTPYVNDLSVNDSNNIENKTSVSVAPAGDDADAIDARTTRVSPASVFAAGAAPGSPLSLEETESAMAALIAKLRPSLERSLSPEESKVAAAAVDFETGGNGPDPGLGSTTAPLLTAGDEGKSGNYREGVLSVSWDMTAMQESTDGGGGVAGKKLDGEASEAATGMYEDDFDVD